MSRASSFAFVALACLIPLTIAQAQYIPFDTVIYVTGSPRGINNAGDVAGVMGNQAFYRSRSGNVTVFAYRGPARGLRCLRRLHQGPWPVAAAVSSRHRAAHDTVYGLNDAGVLVGTLNDVGFATLPCPVTLKLSSRNQGAGSETATVPVMVEDDCGYTMRSSVQWLKGSSLFPPGSALSPSYSVQKNLHTLTPRTAVLTIGGQPFTVTQAGGTCEDALSYRRSFAGGFLLGEGGITPATCPYQGDPPPMRRPSC